MGKIAAVVFALALVGCAGSPIQDGLLFCKGAKPMRPAKSDVPIISDRLTDQIHGHNAVGAKACGWKP